MVNQSFILWRAVDSNGYELDVFLQKRRDKKAAIRFLSRLLNQYQPPRVIITDKLKSYVKPIKHMVNVGRYLNPASRRRTAFRDALSLWGEASRQILCA